MCYCNNNINNITHSVDLLLKDSPKYRNTKVIRDLMIKSYELGQKESHRGLLLRKGIDPEDILKIIEECSGVSVEMIKGNSRKEDVATARKIAIYLIFNNTYSYSKTGRMVNRDHATIMFHIDNFTGFLRSTPLIKDLLNKILRKIDEKQRVD